MYINVETGQFWVIDYRLYDPDGDGQSKLDHVAAMLDGVAYSKQLPFRNVLMDSWYATQKLMAQIDQLEKHYYTRPQRLKLAELEVNQWITEILHLIEVIPLAQGYSLHFVPASMPCVQVGEIVLDLLTC